MAQFLKVIPAYAGVILQFDGTNQLAKRDPRVCGGDPS